MKKHIVELLTATILLTYVCVGYAAVNPITVTYSNGTTSFGTSGSGTANYVVSVNSGVIPPNVPLTFHLTSAGTSSGLTATQQLTGTSCTNVATPCGSTFPLSAGENCCLSFQLTSAKAGNYSLQPSISTTPAAYSAQAASAQPITVTSAPAISYTGIYVETFDNNSQFSSLVTYSADNGMTWGYMLSPQGSWWWNYNIWATATTIVNGTTTMYQATGVQGNGSSGNGAATLIYSSDGVTWNQVTNTLPTLGNRDWVQSLFAIGDTVYAGTGKGYVYYTTNHGSTWSPGVTPTQPDGHTVNAIVVDENGIFYAGTAYSSGTGGTIYYSQDSGHSWTPLISQPSVGKSILSLAIDSNNVLYVITESTTTRPQYNATPTSGSWQFMGDYSGSAGNATTIAATGTTVYVGTKNGYVLYTSNQGGGWNGGALPISNNPIASLFVNQGSLSPLFVESYGIIPLNGGASDCSASGAACTFTVKNLSNRTVTNVHADSTQLPSGVTQTSPPCPSVAPEGACSLTFSASTTGFAPTTFSIIDSNGDAVSEAALVSSMTPNSGADYYYVYAIDVLTGNAYVVDNSDTSNGIIWSSNGTSTDFTSIWGIAEKSTTASPYPNATAPTGNTAIQYTGPPQQQNCNGAADGVCDSKNIYIYYNYIIPGHPVSTSDYAAGLCYANSDGAAVTGEWYLPATCELNGGIYFDVTGNQFGSCSPALTSIFSLYNLGNLGGNLSNLNFTTSPYWSSTEYGTGSKSVVWTQLFASGGTNQSTLALAKSTALGVRCSRALTL